MVTFLSFTGMFLTGVSLLVLMFTLFFGGYIIFTADPNKAQQKKGFQRKFYKRSQWIFWIFLGLGSLWGLTALGSAFISLF